MNKFEALGRLTRDVELRHGKSNGTAYAKAGVAVNRYRGKDREDAVLFIDVTAFGRTGELLNEYYSKGDPILFEGYLEQSKWETEDGEKRSKIECIIDRLHFLPSSRKESGGGEGRRIKTEDVF